jgi:hypothetical protein
MANKWFILIPGVIEEDTSGDWLNLRRLAKPKKA